MIQRAGSGVCAPFERAHQLQHVAGSQPTRELFALVVQHLLVEALRQFRSLLDVEHHGERLLRSVLSRPTHLGSESFPGTVQL